MAKKDESRTFLISVAAELAGMHAQTLRTYDRLGLVRPRRTSGGGRRYSEHDVELLREVQRLSQHEGVNLAGIKRIIELTNQVEALQAGSRSSPRRSNGCGPTSDATLRWCRRAPRSWCGSRAARPPDLPGCRYGGQTGQRQMDRRATR
ncbi:merR regulatory family protein [Mycobacterium xenopi 4042]|uniref:MerR regulatory family protein n=1 Tax=Mycobacterium xenopi 4042 TaxID=1299334 RepID=X8DKM0_MYCXE|nr:merR regulatory family protein [Mycobacterium xenopi 4042]